MTTSAAVVGHFWSTSLSYPVCELNIYVMAAACFERGNALAALE